jgi:hypothetical protein
MQTLDLAPGAVFDFDCATASPEAGVGTRG